MEASNNMDLPSVNLLSLDGGGIRGVSELLILNEIMYRIQCELKLSKLPRPCDFFHLIGGTSTGGLIAIMLGRLRMTTKEALQAYSSLAESIFSKSNHERLWRDGKFKAETLEEAVKAIVEERRLGKRMLLKEDAEDSRTTGNAFVCAMPALNLAHPRNFRSYKVTKNATPNCNIWEAARATTAAPTFFKRISIGEEGLTKEPFIDGALGCNNPVKEVMLEARSIWGDDATLNCLVSLGTGLKDVNGIPRPTGLDKVLPASLVKAVARMATDCDKTAFELRTRFAQRPNKYFRFNVQRGAEKVGLAEWEKMPELQTHTTSYITEVSNEIDVVVKALCRPRDYSDLTSAISLRELCGEFAELGGESSVAEVYQTSCPLPSALFTGQGDILDILEDRFRATAARAGRREFLISGLGGAGKTQVALKFAEVNRRRFRHTFYIDATNRDTIERGYRDIALQIDPTLDLDCSIDTAMEQLESMLDEWLLVFDGADDVDAASTLWPPGKQGNIIYTSRNSMLRGLPPRYKYTINVMNPDEAVALLLKAANLEDDLHNRGKALDIAIELGYLPLAIVLAGAYIASGVCFVDDFCEYYRNNHRALLRTCRFEAATEQNKAVFAIWDLSYNAIVQAAESKAPIEGSVTKLAATAALWLLDIFAYFHNESILEDIFRNAAENPYRIRCYGPTIDLDSKLHRGAHLPDKLLELNAMGEWDNTVFREGIRVLVSYSLITRSVLGHQFSLHRLVHEWNSDRPHLRDSQNYIMAAGDLISASVRITSKLTEHAYHRALLPHVDAWCSHQGLHRDTDFTAQYPELAWLYFSLGKWAKAEELELQLLAARTTILGSDHPDTLSSKLNLGSIYLAQGRLHESESLHLAISEPLMRHCGPDHPTVRSAAANLALIHQWQARNSDAEEATVSALRRNESILGPKDLETLANGIQLADIYIGQKRWKEARQQIDKVTVLTREEHGPEHPITIRSIGCLVFLYISQKHLKAAEQLQTQTLEKLTDVLGEEDPRTIAAMAQLASIYTHDGQYKQAIILGERILKVQEQVNGPEHPNTIASLNNLAFAYKVGGQRIRAMELMHDAIAKFTKIHGLSHPNTRDAAEALDAWKHPMRSNQLSNEITEYFVRRNNLIARRVYSRW